MTNYREILRLHSQGFSQRGIAASCECSRNIVAKVLQKAAELNMIWPLTGDPSNSELSTVFATEATVSDARKRPDYERIHREMGKH
ncbi:MAG: hypothetical protein WCP79_09265 [Bacillota bacterium]